MKILNIMELITRLDFILTTLLLIIINSVIAHDSVEIAFNGTAEIGKSFTLICKSNSPNTWKRSDVIIANSTTRVNKIKNESLHESRIEFPSLHLDDFGNYTCYAHNQSKSHYLSFETIIELIPSDKVKKVKEGSRNISLSCSARGFPLDKRIKWTLEKSLIQNSERILAENVNTNLTSLESSLLFYNVSHGDNGTYSCSYEERRTLKIVLVVQSEPTIFPGYVLGVSTNEIYVNWTVLDRNDPISSLKLTYFDIVGNKKVIDLPSNENYKLVQNLTLNSIYSNFTISARNSIGESEASFSKSTAKTLSFNPSFVPVIRVQTTTITSISVTWNENKTDFHHFYEVMVKDLLKGKELIKNSTEAPYMIENLDPGTKYSIKVRACSAFTFRCDAYSGGVEAETMDGTPSPPLHLNVSCKWEGRSGRVDSRWDPPADPQGRLTHYSISLNSSAVYVNESGLLVSEEGGVRDRKTNTSPEASFTGLLPNTVYSVRVCGRNRNRMDGSYEEKSCRMGESTPSKEVLSRGSWKTVESAKQKKFYFMLSIPPISQRNGSICCIKIVVVRMDINGSLDGMKEPGSYEILSYHQAHNTSTPAAYLAEILDPVVYNSSYPTIFIGNSMAETSGSCSSCLRSVGGIDNTVEGSSGNYRTSHNFHNKGNIRTHRKRHGTSNGFSSHPLTNSLYDGPLDPNSFYTAYLESFVLSSENGDVLSETSRFYPPLRPSRSLSSSLSPSSSSPSLPSLSLTLSSLLLALSALLLSALCLYRVRRQRQKEEEEGRRGSDGGGDINDIERRRLGGGGGGGLPSCLMQWWRRMRGQEWLPSSTLLNFPTIKKEELVSAFLQRHKDSDLGFQAEFESLPDRFNDRSCFESERRENQGKNRYPDIKAYDQTRVRLSVDENGSSDYINANYVVGYKERKKFICAQGPMEGTVVDWWKLVWEQRVSLILMLTNTEEYNKTKCAKYWPSESSSQYGNITVTHSSEKRFSDYLVRKLRVERNGDEREVSQYHYLEWKDFMAPEYPVGIIRFIKRFNESHSSDPCLGPILVHCSAGVGRTGTLVALHSLLEQLSEEGGVSILSTIYDLRHQRNFLVQSLKQYVFIYRALMEAAQFGDTEVELCELKTSLERLKKIEDGKSKSLLEEEFDKLSQVIEDRKSMTVGYAEENRHRNRHENVIPYDRSIVILLPLPNANNEICTYINASFIQGYENREEFIMTQDPLENTIGEFWRMIVEQNVRSIIMLSEVGEESCPRYWPEKDQETAHEFIRVKYMQSQSGPFYYKREFTVTNGKTDESTVVTQFQYNGWPVGAGEVPESTRGLVELVDTTLKHFKTITLNTGPTVVHCSDGAQRSCIYVALAILVKQMETEPRVDIFSIVRKLRSQRQNLFQNFNQYEFLYRGLLTYSELHMTNGVDTLLM